MTTISVKSWQQLCLEADPAMHAESAQAWVYMFANGRKFHDPAQLYTVAPTPEPLPLPNALTLGGEILTYSGVQLEYGDMQFPTSPAPVPTPLSGEGLSIAAQMLMYNNNTLEYTQ